MLMFVASTPLFLNNSWAATDTVYVDFTPRGNESIDAYGYNDFGFIYSGETESSGYVYTAENNGTSQLSSVTVECTANSGGLTAVDDSPGNNQFSIKVDDSGADCTWSGISAGAVEIETNLDPTSTETFAIQIELGTLSSGSPAAENCTLTVTGTD